MRTRAHGALLSGAKLNNCVLFTPCIPCCCAFDAVQAIKDPPLYEALLQLLRNLS